jgi:hypothetical protein
MFICKAAALEYLDMKGGVAACAGRDVLEPRDLPSMLPPPTATTLEEERSFTTVQNLRFHTRQGSGHGDVAGLQGLEGSRAPGLPYEWFTMHLALAGTLICRPWVDRAY